MKNIVSFVWLLAFLLCGCSKEDQLQKEPSAAVGRVFTTSFEGGESRVYVEGGTSLRWTKQDRVSLFDGSTLNREYVFGGETGDASGSFHMASKPDGTGSSLSANYAVYPYSPSMTMAADGTITLTLPYEQRYAENSFGLGANTMVAVTEDKDDTSLQFKNVGACMQIRLYADEETVVKTITLTGNKGEKIAGRATITAEYGAAPVVSMADDATTSITLNCGTEGIPLSNSSGEPTVFWMVLPPVTFAEGFTLTVTDMTGKVFTRTTETEAVFVRNGGRKTAPVKVVPQEVAPQISVRDALIQLYNSTGGDNWTHKDNWCSDMPITQWYGVSEVSTGLYEVKLGNNGLTGTINQTFPDELVTLNVYDNSLTSVDVSGSKGLQRVSCYSNQLTSLDVSDCTRMENLYCNGNLLTSLNVSGCTGMKYLLCYDNKLTSLDVSGFTMLKTFGGQNNLLRSLNVSGCTSLSMLYCQYNDLSSLDVSDCTALIDLQCNNNKLTSLNVSGCANLAKLSCRINELPSLDFTGCTRLTELTCDNNELTTLDVSGCANLAKFYCYSNQLTTLDVSGCTDLTYFDCSYNPLTTLSVGGIASLISLDVSNCTSLTELYCEGNYYADNQLTSLKVSGCTALKVLNCRYYYQLTSLDVSECTALEFLVCSHNGLTSLNVSGCTALKQLSCEYNQLTSLNVTGFTALELLHCEYNQLTSLNVTGCTELCTLYCNDNNILSEISDWLSQILFSYDQRYTYSEDANGNTQYTDNGKGWWYPGEPTKGYHGPN